MVEQFIRTWKPQNVVWDRDIYLKNDAFSFVDKDAIYSADLSKKIELNRSVTAYTYKFKDYECDESGVVLPGFIATLIDLTSTLSTFHFQKSSYPKSLSLNLDLKFNSSIKCGDEVYLLTYIDSFKDKCIYTSNEVIDKNSFEKLATLGHVKFKLILKNDIVKAHKF